MLTMEYNSARLANMRTGRLRVVIFTAAGLAIALVLAFITIKSQSSSSPQSEPALTAPVQVLKLQRRDIARTLTLPANISPWYQATLYAKVPGYLKWMGFDKGDTVKKGQLLAVIDAPEVEQQYRQAQADYKIKRITYQRKHSVWKENPDVIAKQDVDVAEAEAEAARHIMDHRRTLLEYTSVAAPFVGLITARFADPGALIQSASGSATQAAPLYTIMDLDTVRVYVSVPQEAAMLAEPGIPATLSLKESPDQVFRGTITRTAGALDPATRTLLVEIDLPNPQHVLKPGMYVTATLYLERHLNALALPPTAVVRSDKGKFVFVVRDGTARRMPIKTGLDDGVWLEVTEGLSGDEHVVVVGQSGLTDGQAVRVSAYALPAGKSSSQKY
jgi:RND family efflux transporter MFP subunit